MAKRKGEATLVEQIKEAIRASGLSLNQISQACGVDRGRISRFLRGERDLTLAAASRIFQALGLRVARGQTPEGD